MQKQNLKDNVISKFRKLWNSLSVREKEELWDIMAALRGNDRGANDDVKFATTGRIRGEFLGQNYSRGYTFTSFAEARKEIEFFTNNHRNGYKPHKVKAHYLEKSWHFKQHIKQAIQALNRYRPKSSMRDLQKFLKD